MNIYRVFFPDYQGLCQVDLISPCLFSLLAEMLGRTITRKHVIGQWKGILIARGIEATAHSQFVDDTCFFSVASMEEVRTMKTVLEMYRRATGQVVNRTKSELFFQHGVGISKSYC